MNCLAECNAPPTRWAMTGCLLLITDSLTTDYFRTTPKTHQQHNHVPTTGAL
jgi:hypothetical protein